MDKNENKTFDDRVEFGDEQFAGVRFRNVSVPQGANIISAKLRFRAEDDDDKSLTVRIYGENSDNATVFTGSYGTIKDRTKTSAYVDWAPSDWNRDSTYESPDISNIVQQIVNRSGWFANSSMVLLIDPMSSNEGRRFYSHDDNPGKAAQLEITYDGAATDESLLVGLRFQGVGIPQGATVTSAVLEFEAADTASGAVSISIKGEDVDDAAPFQSTANNISSRAVTDGQSLGG